MKHFIFKTTATMKEYNAARWWIDPGVMPEKHIHAETIAEALTRYQTEVENMHYISISNNAIKNKSAMYIDTSNGPQQVGYVITGRTEFEDRDAYRWSTQFIDLWVNVLTVIDTDFEEVSV